MSNIQINSSMLTFAANLNLPQKELDRKVASGELDPASYAEIMVARRSVKETAAKPRVSKTSADLGSLAAEIVAELQDRGVDANFKVTAEYDSGKRAGEAQTVILYRDDTGATLELTRGKAEAVLAYERTMNG